MRTALLALLLVACSGGGGSTYAPDAAPSPMSRAPYDTMTKTNVGVGAFVVHVQCTTPTDRIDSGACLYENVIPTMTSQGLDQDGWYCAGTAREDQPFGWVVTTLHCVP